MRHTRKLNNYLRTYRRTVGFTQKEIGYLLGYPKDYTGRRRIGRHEKSECKPDVEALLAYQLIFGAPATELFAGTQQKVEQTTRRRAGHLLERLEQTESPDALTLQKLEALRKIAGPAPEPYDDEEKQRLSTSARACG